ncbi:hypothetical protein GSI_05789 [Ganoderma sinense ZZ0214-1]|uniref:F-box domain-containing protein n=1 Tax=Ganoderma sinense ZZ0214-1 TaxID=1077348 RepID=A0A2G8SBH9_9APHY|nr:hypothetical protein GSI_05789 [Ganoderma sinense ZZ0214-1]
MDLLGQPRLNLDILRLACNYLTDVPDVLYFALTCSALTEDGFRRRLSMSPINLPDAESVHSFHTFIFSNELGRAPFIHGLELGKLLFDDVEEDDLELQTVNNRLVAILQGASHIQYLRFPSDMTLDPVFAAAANTTTLRKIHMVFVSSMEPSWKLLPTFHSPLRSLRIDGSYRACNYFCASLLSDNLATFAPTLEVLDLFELVLDLPPSSVTTQFTAVRSLGIGMVSDFGGLEILLQLFPNLSDRLSLGEIDTLGDRDHATTTRECSKEAQQTNTWPRLDRVECDAESAFLMALQCPIGRMDVMLSHDSHVIRYLAPVLRDNCPRILRLTCFGPFNAGLDGVDSLFPPRGWSGKRKIISWKPTMDKLIDSVKHLRLTHLRLVLRFATVVHKPTQDSVAARDTDTVSTAGDMDLRSTALRFVDAIPSLRHIFLSVMVNTYDSPPSNASKVWRIVRELRPTSHEDHQNGPNANLESSGACVELSWAVAERVIAEEEELLLSPN